jgi:phosphatidylglycerophosphate synthase
VALAAYAAAVAIALRGLRSYPHDTIGLCNLVTLFRVVLVCALIAVVVAPGAHPWLVFAVASVALALDGIDGWLARRYGHSSRFGAVFDMEVDAVLALTLALLGYFGGQAGLLVLLLGIPRYLFWGAQMATPWLDGPLPERFSRKLVCVIQIAVLIAILLPALGAARTAAQRMQSNTQQRGIHQGFFTMSQENKTWYAGIRSSGLDGNG